MNKSPLQSPKSPRPLHSQNVIANPSSTLQPSEDSRYPTNRPRLHRQPRSSPSEQSESQSRLLQQSLEHQLSGDHAPESDVSSGLGFGREEDKEMGGDGGLEGVKGRAESPDEAELERLRQAIHERMLQNQQRARMSASTTGTSPVTLGARRVSPIKEEAPSGLSPTLEASFSSPLPTGHTTSTESTESSKTIRGSVPAPPAGQPLRTPSYPFPFIPSTPRNWSSTFHQPFTTLSPTISATNARDVSTPRENVASGASTPAASTTTFMPPGTSQPAMEDSRYPSPNLYDLVLLISSEPGLGAWWSIVTTIMRDWYGAERATLAVPADTSDIENVPWGQKTTYNVAGPSETRQPLPAQEPVSSKAQQPEVGGSSIQESDSSSSPTSLNPGKRPKLESRHSFAGYERQRRDISSENKGSGAPVRPRGPLRTVSYAPLANVRTEHPLRQVAPASLDGSLFFSKLQAGDPPYRDPSFSDPEFSSIGGDIPSGPYAAVFSVLRALDHESDVLIDNIGVNRVLERGRLVTLTRDYSSTLTPSKKFSEPASEEHLNKVSTLQTTQSSVEIQKVGGIRNRSGNAARRSSLDHSDPRLAPHYEEYEQFPSSPWAQSPAPSPAIQADPSSNPFFTAASVDEETFNPTSSSQDYSQYGQVEAIGVDKASTVTHIPLIHPILSQPMQPLNPGTPLQTPTTSGRSADNSKPAPSEQGEFQRKAPIAILSILSSTVPYPHNLTNSLKLLGPHLATSFSNAWQYSNAHKQATNIKYRHSLSGHQVGFAPMSDPDRLGNLMHLDIDDMAGSAAGSVTSPSDYSGRSRHSPGGSIGGTPGWDPSTVGFSSRHSVGGTPGHLSGMEAVESYFDAKKRSNLASTTKPPTMQVQQDQSVRKNAIVAEQRPVMKAGSVSGADNEEDAVTPRSEQKPKSENAGPEEIQEQSPRKSHSFLHSYGADFSSSFQSLPAATTPGPRTPGPSQGHARTSSITETLDMPPPSERLLRTIIDSLPVQIFTAQPNTGVLTWVNSKFLVYRGQDSRQVLQEPWHAIHPEDRGEYMEMWNKCLRTGTQLQQKVRLQRFDGHYRWFYVRAAPLKDRRQQIVHWIGTNMDFHEQHLAEVNSARQQETAASEAKYRALANSSPQIVFVVTSKRGITFCNSQWTSYSGQPEAQALSIGFLEHVHPEDIVKCRLPEMNEDGSAPINVPTSIPIERTHHPSPLSDNSSETSETVTSPSGSPHTMELPQAKLSKLAGEGILKVAKDADGRPSYSTEVRLRSKDGNYRWHLVRILLEDTVLSNDNEEETWYGTCTDINDHKLLEQTLKETMDAKSRFLSNMSHEIRTPLNGITGMVNFLLDSTLSPEQMEQVNIIRNSTEGLRDLINDILDLSKVEAGMIILNVDWLHLPSLIEEVNDLTSALAIGKGLELNYLVEEDVPSMVKGDRFRIRQVLLNVIGNAIKFTQKGEVFVRCQLPTEKGASLKKYETLIQFEVIDTGNGFTEKEAEFLFKRFSQIDASSTRQHGGTGLGLAISMQLVELHGGNMKATSVPGKGSNFTFTIKFALPSEDDHPPPEAITPSSSLAVENTPTPLALDLTQVSTSTSEQRISSESSSQGELVKSPVPSLPSSERSRDSPYLSSGSSDPSVYTGRTSIRSERSSASSFMPDTSLPNASITLAPPPEGRATGSRGELDEPLHSNASSDTVKATPMKQSLSPLGSSFQPPMYSILVVCSLDYSREATVKHIEMTLPKTIPHQITAQASLVDAQKTIGGDDPVLFTHVVLVLHEPSEAMALMDEVFKSSARSSTSIVIISDTMQKREIMRNAPDYNYDKLVQDRRLRFIYKPLKPSKFAVVFDPQKEREMSTDRNQDSAQQVAMSQKLVFEDLKRRLGNKGHKVLLVEDNYINQTVVLKFLSKVSVTSETVLDGVQCTEKVFSQPHGYYSIILCDLHMPNKDGYQACKEIRRWEKKNKYSHLPIIALSANVLGDVYAKCVEAGFNSYVTKPVEFKELSLVLTNFLDPENPSKPHKFMRPRVKS
ncbi:uncharacterized protein K441DRAFT_552571 [Cenococcum geophilum 1.58]|uniref:uncharacterized protein n=1 Tax=Cenococcum geophilum 1.58 TaxID=794803 RepID=UPI00358F9C2F|nr:hypothetical protein K441DRAFT_552571 [Cenococcum geophilum 1.58]